MNPDSLEGLGARLLIERYEQRSAVKHEWAEISRRLLTLEHVERQYSELVDALCSRSWMGRNRHASVVALAKRYHDSQTIIRPLELEDVALAAGYCIRESGHDGPCNGLPRNDCYLLTEKA